MKYQGATLGLLAVVAGNLAASGAAHAGVMGAGRPGMMSSDSIIVFIVGVVVGGLIVYFWRRNR
jgi:hypothetical protein